MTIIAPTVNNRYQIIDQIGQGGMGAVYRATDRLTGHVVALKQVTIPGDRLQFVSFGRSADVRLDLAQEFKTLASLRHPNIISVLDYGFDQTRRPYFTMDYLAQAQTIVTYGRDQPFRRKIDLLSQVLQALAYLHRRGIIHRDLKPDNVLVIADQVKLLDFGLAIRREHVGQADLEAVGTVAYMAPELLLGEPASEAADLYALGVISYELFAGRHPFDTRSLELLLLDIHQVDPDLTGLGIDESLQALLARLLNKLPKSRYADAQAVLRALAEVTGQQIALEPLSIRDSYLQAARFVGRQTELAQLSEALAQVVDAAQPTGSAWLVGGESGVGKSRLLDELRTLALVEGALVVRSQGVEGGGLIYQLWRTPLRRLILMVAPDDTEAAILKEVIPDIEGLLGRPIPDIPGLDSDRQQQRLIKTITDLFRHLGRPMVLIMEDLHWAIESLEPLKSLIMLTREVPMLLIGSFRDDEAPDLPEQLPGSRVMKLKRLTIQAVTELSAAMLGPAGSQPEVIDLLLSETDGNVFFLVEVVRSLAAEVGRLSDISRATLPKSVIAGGVQQIVRRRLSRFPAEAQPMLKLAAVAGRYLDLAILEHLGGVHQDALPPGLNLENWLTLAVDMAVLEVQEGQWRFIHDRLRQTVVDDLADDESPRLHRRVAEAIESVYAGDEAQALILVAHWQAAQDRAKAIHYTRLSMDQLWAVNNRLGTIVFAKELLHLLIGEMGADPVELPTLLDRTYQRLVAYHQAAAGPETVQIIVATLHRLGEALYSLTDIPAARGALTTALAAARLTGDAARMNWILFWLSQVAMIEGDYAQTERYLEESLSLARSRADQAVLTAILVGLGDLHWHRGALELAQSTLGEALILARQIGDTGRELYILNRLGTIACAQDDLDEGQRIFEEILPRILQSGNPAFAAGVMSNLGEVAERRGDLNGAQMYYRQGLSVFRETDQPLHVTALLNSLAGVFIRLGQPDRARAYLQEGLTLALQIAAMPQVLSAIRNAGWLRLAAGQTAEGLALIGLALTHPAANSEIRKAVTLLLADLALDQTDPAIATALAAGQELDLVEVTGRLLAEWRGSPKPDQPGI